MSLLTMAQDAADRIGIPRPSSLIGGTDQQAKAFLAAANQEGKELARRHPWQALIKETTFTTVAQAIQTSAIPADFDRIIEGSMFNRTQTRPVVGPLTPQRWQQLQSTLSAAVWDAFRIRGDEILFEPVPTAGETIAYEYVTKYWCASAGDSAPDQAAFAVDSDIVWLDEEAMTRGIHWRFLRANRLDYAEEFRLYEEEVARLIGRDGGETILDLSAPELGRAVYDPYIDDSGWSL